VFRQVLALGKEAQKYAFPDRSGCKCAACNSVVSPSSAEGIPSHCSGQMNHFSELRTGIIIGTVKFFAAVVLASALKNQASEQAARGTYLGMDHEAKRYRLQSGRWH
jgi:hypothetical protein